MMDVLQRRPLTAILAGVAAALLLAIGVETGFGTRLRHDPPAEPSKAAAPPDAKLLPPLALVSPEMAYPETTARPLFVPTRRPAPVENVAKSSFERGQYVLQGVIVVGDQRTALLKEKTSGRIHRVDKGKDLNGVTVEAVEPTKVTLAMGGERETLNLTVQKAVQQAAKDALGNRPGAVVALDPRDGSIIAMWSFPSYDPEAISQLDSKAAEQGWGLLNANPAKPLLPRAFRESFFDSVPVAAILLRRPRSWLPWWRSGVGPLLWRRRLLRPVEIPTHTGGTP